MEKQVEPKPKMTKETLREALKIFEFVRPYKWKYIFGLALLFLSSSVFLIFPFITGKMLDVAQGKIQMTDVSLPTIGLILVVVLAFQGILSYIRVMLFARVSEGVAADIRKQVYQRLIAMPIVFFEKNRVGELVSRLTNDVEKIYNTFYFVLAEFIRQIILLVGGIFFLAWQAPRLSVIMLAVFPVIVIGAMLFGRRIRKLSRERQDLLGTTNTVLDETLQSIHAVKAFTNEIFETRRYGRSNDQVIDLSMRFASQRALFAVFIITVLFGALFFVMWMGMRMVQADIGLPPEADPFTAGKLVSFVTFTALIGAAIAGLGNFYSELLAAVGSTERVREILNAPIEEDLRKPNGKIAQKLQGDIQFKDIFFSYPTRDDVPVLKGINLSIEPGSKVALVGQSGAGKSTIMQLLLQFHKPLEGTITVDGTLLQDYDLASYRKNFAIVPQEVILFGGTIGENILYGKPEATEAEVIKAAQEANAWEFISRFPEGLQTVVGERGIKLSGGQRQRIAIARAILRDPSILLLDEATSSLDAESEKVVQDALNNLMRGRTSIIIAHRLATVREVDCIYVLDGGRIIEQGTHEVLSAVENGAYSSLAKLQFDNGASIKEEIYNKIL